MSTRNKIEEDFKNYLRSKDEVSISVLRLLKSAVKNKEIEKKQELSEEEIIELILKEIKKRKESINIYKKAKRVDLAEKEEKEKIILEKYAPEQLSGEELEKIIDEEVSKLGALGPSDMGRVMSKVMSKIKGRMDRSIVSSKVNELLKHGDE